ncbi:prephenate dehydrogenase [Neobacillus sp. PS3-40]|uniref:prephenate dehydrogenase n=1 Tax=Neobacillus sp. PS3-40 TaxID=3070679 RepID=UPI0027E1C0B8|nr:prephenate dehydrogenase [Neobacillus sp. PS3-40]WML45106.1 prephenate dehydrogenase [Neobacillus sp. PS3-40]
MNGHVFVIGLGLIGGSLALCIKNVHKESTITGYDINYEQAGLAKALGVIDDYVTSIQEGAINADLIIISAPVNESEVIIQLLSKLPLKKDVIITDTGSTKRKIVQVSSCLLNQGITFIGGHPMAGSHKSGISAAKKILFENAFYLLTPEKQISEEKIEVLKKWFAGTKAKFLTITPDEHDYITGIVSHFPHIIAASLVRQTEKLADSKSLIPRLAAGGFRDITRIASSSPIMWSDILLQNKEVLLNLLGQWMDEMESVKTLLEQENSHAILNFFQEAKQYRDGLPIKEKGAIPAFYDLFVDVPDYPGVISEITGYLATEKISITNIRIIEAREGIYGVLSISFQTEEDRKRAEECINSYTDYSTFIGS